MIDFHSEKTMSDRALDKLSNQIITAVETRGRFALNLENLNVLIGVIDDFKAVEITGKDEIKKTVPEMRNDIRLALQKPTIKKELLRDIIARIETVVEVMPEIDVLRWAIKDWFAPRQALPEWVVEKQVEGMDTGVFVKLGEIHTIDRNANLGVYGGRVYFSKGKRKQAGKTSDKIIADRVWNNEMWVDGDVKDPKEVHVYEGEQEARESFVPWTAKLNHQWKWPDSTLRNLSPKLQAIFSNVAISPGGPEGFVRGDAKDVGIIYSLRSIQPGSELTLDYGHEYWNARQEGLRKPIWDWTDLSLHDVDYLHSRMNDGTETAEELQKYYNSSNVIGEVARQKKQKLKERALMEAKKLTVLPTQGAPAYSTMTTTKK